MFDAIITQPLAPILEEEAHSFASSVLDPENRFATATCDLPIIPVLVELAERRIDRRFPHSWRRGRLAPGLSPNGCDEMGKLLLYFSSVRCYPTAST